MGVSLFQLSNQYSNIWACCPQAGAVLHSFERVIHSLEDCKDMLSKQVPLNMGIGLDISDSSMGITPECSFHNLLARGFFHLRRQFFRARPPCGLFPSPSSLRRESSCSVWTGRRLWSVAENLTRYTKEDVLKFTRFNCYGNNVLTISVCILVLSEKQVRIDEIIYSNIHFLYRKL